MRMRYSGMTIFILLAILASISSGLAQESGALAADQVAGDTIDATAVNTTNTTVVKSAVPEGPADVQGHLEDLFIRHRDNHGPEPVR